MTIALSAPLSPARLRVAERVRADGAIGQLVRYAGVGTAGAGLYLGLYLLANLFLPTLAANVLAWLVSTVATNEVQRRLAFHAGHSDHATADVTVGMVTSLASLAVSSVALAVLSGSTAMEQLLVLVTVTAAVGLARFLIVRAWFAHHG